MAIYEHDPLTNKIIGFAIEIHRQLGPGLLEAVYEECLCLELKQAGHMLRRQLALPVVYKSVRLDCGYRLDIVVENQVILEIKSRRAHHAGPRGTTLNLHETERHSYGSPA